MEPFVISKNGKTYDYRLGYLLPEKEIRAYFEKLGYKIEKLWMGTRHELGILRKNNQKFFLKLATSEGQSILIENEIFWNKQVGELLSEKDIFCVPRVFETGKFQEKYVWEITEYWQGRMLSSYPLSKDFNDASFTFASMIRIIEAISNLRLSFLPLDLLMAQKTPQEFFLEKARGWFNGIPKEVRQQFKIKRLLKIAEEDQKNLKIKPRHGDFAPWHMMKLKNGKIGLFDAEHAMAKGVEFYDLGYFIQRVYSVLEDPELAKKIFLSVIPAKAGIYENRLRIILAARAIGGFLDESLTPCPNFHLHEDFMNWVLQI